MINKTENINLNSVSNSDNIAINSNESKNIESIKNNNNE